ncbi:Uncharacterized protein TCM_019648 [Theobroma cacao]|uniref:Uncharacterized protein n=1 Tax=Theobroma cacao TaxID=3641 RepID=A0A061EIY3_THECC|nr:Uncharacterized protein TCM_019648 [Theobroma cacao]
MLHMSKKISAAGAKERRLELSLAGPGGREENNEAKDNHEVPAARSSGHVNSSGCNLPPTVPNNIQAAVALARNTKALKPETPIQDIVPPFDQKPEFKNEYLRPSCLRDFSNEMKLGAASLASVYQVKFPSIQNTIPYGSFGMCPKFIAAHQSGSIALTEVKDDSLYNACLPIVDQASASSSAYQQANGNFPS